MSSIRRFLSDKLDVTAPFVARYCAVYILIGAVLQVNADHIHIARFARNWQVLTIYGGVLVPLSLMVRRLPWHAQYAYSAVIIAPLDLVGFAIQSSVAYPGNVLEDIFGPRSFTLSFVLLAAWIPVLGNQVLSRLCRESQPIRSGAAAHPGIQGVPSPTPSGEPGSNMRNQQLTNLAGELQSGA